MQSIFGTGNTLNCSINQPVPSDRTKVVRALIKYPGSVVYIRLLQKRIRRMGVAAVKGLF